MIDLEQIVLQDTDEEEEKPKKKTRKKREREVLLAASPKAAQYYFVARMAAEDVLEEFLKDLLPLLSQKEDDIERELKRLQLEELKDRIHLKREMRKELIPMFKGVLSQITLQQQLQSALSDCVRRKKLALARNLRKSGLSPVEIQLELLDKEPEIVEQCESEIQQLLQAYQGENVDLNELPTPDEEGEDEEE